MLIETPPGLTSQGQGQLDRGLAGRDYPALVPHSMQTDHVAMLTGQGILSVMCLNILHLLIRDVIVPRIRGFPRL